MSKQIIVVVNQKGGVGKTTTAINVAANLASPSCSVLLVDFDPQGNTTSGLGLSKDSLGGSCYDVLCRDSSLAQVVQESRIPGLFILPSNADLAGAEIELVNQKDREFKLENALKTATYDYIIIDCPPSLGLLTINALAASNWVLIPVQAEYYALEGLGQLLQTFQRVRQAINPSLELLGVVLTMYDKRTSLSEQVQQELKNYFGDKLFKTIVPRNIRLAEAPSFGKTIFEHDRWSKGARAYKQLTREVQKRAG
jgi:chromosome partitioning protein